MSFWPTLILTILEIVREIAPLLVKWFAGGDQKLVDIRQRALDLQNQAAQTARGLVEGKEDEISRSAAFKSMLIDQLFRERSLRKKINPQPSTKSESDVVK